MAGRIPDETLQAIRDRVNIVEVVSQYVNLKRAGRNHLGLCPFHSEKTPSFTVSDERGLFHCFGCGAGGSVFNFLMRMERLEFREAVEQLAKRAGVELPKERDAATTDRRERLYAVNEHAARFFADTLKGPIGADARAYLARRGLAPEIAAQYGLGFAPASGTALAASLAQRQLPRELGLELGLLGKRADGSVYDRFRGRLMFPIRDRRARVIGFGGRTMGTDQPKYLNSPESILFRKGEGLYGIAEARDAIRDANRVVVVEGYMDVLLLVQHAIPYAVAVLGTALTERQLQLLRPFGGDELTVFFFFDGDRAGRAAVKRAFKACVDAGFWGRAAFLPEGHDPDSYVRDKGGPATLTLLEASAQLQDAFFDGIAPPAGAPLQQRARVAEEVRQVLASARTDVQRQLLMERAAVRLGLSDELLRGTAPVPVRPQPAATATRLTAPQWPAEEVGLLEAIAADGAVAAWVGERGTLALFRNAELASVGEQLVDAWERHGDVASVIDGFNAELVGRLTAAALHTGPFSDMDPMKLAQDCAARVDQQVQRAQRRAGIDALRHAERSGDEQSSQARVASLSELLRRPGGPS